MTRSVLLLWTALWLAGCSGGTDKPGPADGGPTDGGAAARKPLTLAQLKDPTQCKKCHTTHYREWASSMHAYAAKDPVFLAMNARGQRETKGELGTFCVKCHAPMAVLDGKTKDGLNLAELPAAYQGITCFFCHDADGVEGDHNAMLHLAGDTTMRGGIQNPKQPGVHRAAFSPFFDGNRLESSAMCGGCHDIVTPAPASVHLERTFAEYKMSFFTQPNGFDTCAGCHMRGTPGLAANDPPSNVPSRTVHEHVWPGVDVPLTDNPDRDAMQLAVQDCELAQSISLFTVDATPFGQFTFTIETAAGHNEPSGASQDRRLWLEVTAYDADGKAFFHSGDIADGELEEKPDGDPKQDKNLWLFRDRIYDAQGAPVHMFWQAAPSTDHPNGYESDVLQVGKTAMAGSHSRTRVYQILAPSASGSPALPARLTARLRMRPMGVDVLQDLVDSGDLDSAIISQMPTFTLQDAILEWKSSDLGKPVMANAAPIDCDTYRCMLDPSSSHCGKN
jgi:hypothetical protein